MGRKFSSLSYSIQKFGQKIALFRPSPYVIAVAVMGTAIFLLGGGVYDILMQPSAILPIGQGRYLSFVPYRIHEQLLAGSMGVMVCYALGAAGLLVIYGSTRYVRNPSQVSLYMAIGVAMLIIAFIAVEAVLYWVIHF